MMDCIPRGSGDFCDLGGYGCTVAETLLFINDEDHRAFGTQLAGVGADRLRVRFTCSTFRIVVRLLPDHFQFNAILQSGAVEKYIALL